MSDNAHINTGGSMDRVSMDDAVRLYMAYGVPLDAENMRQDVDEANKYSTCYGEGFVLLQTYTAHRRSRLHGIDRAHNGA